MARFPAVYSEDESTLLIAIYENPNMSYDAYWFAQQLSPGIPVHSPDLEPAFKKAVRTIEDLVLKGLVDGKQAKGPFGMYYKDLKLKYKGKQEAIRERDRIAKFNKELPKIVAEANAVVEEMRKWEKK